jgi:hypothetical protein
VVEDPVGDNLEKGKGNQTPELAGVPEHASGGRIVEEHKEERDNQDEDKGVTVNSSKSLGIFFFLLGAL